MPFKKPGNNRPSKSGAPARKNNANTQAPRKPAPQPQPEEKQPGLLTSLDNDKVRFLRNLQTKKDRYAAKHFLVEGVRLVDEALRAARPPYFTLYDSEALLKTEPGKRLLQRLIELVEDKKGVYPATAKVMETVSDTVTPQGVSAAVPFLDWKPEDFSQVKLHLILDGLQDPGNLGTILRSAGGAGETAIWLTENCVDFYSPKVVRAGMGAHFRVPSAIDKSWESIKTQLKTLGVEQILLADSDSEDSVNSRPRRAGDLPELTYYEVDWTKPCAVIIGNEAHGASNNAWLAATHRLTIPMPGGAESLNAAVAASLIVFEALRQRSYTEQEK